MLLNLQRYFLRPVIIISALLIVRLAKAQQPATIQAQIDSTQILIGDQFHLQLNADVNSSQENIIWNNIPDSFDHIIVVDRSKIDTANVNGQVHYHQQLTLTSFDSGQWKIPSFDFKIIPFNNNDTTALYASTDSLLINVNTVPVDTTKPFNPIKSIRTVTLSWLDYIWYIIAGAVLALLIIGVIIYLRKRKRKPIAPPPPKPKAPPFEIALKELRQMEADKAWQQMDTKTYYTKVTDVLREYIEQQFSVPAMELTTDELMQNIKTVTVLSQQKDALQRVLMEADLVKFAKMQPSQEEEYYCLRHIIEIVEWTRPKPKEDTNTK